MPTTERERYHAAQAVLEAAKAEFRRADLMAQIALNRVRQAEEEGFDEEAMRREEQRQTRLRDVDHERAIVARLAIAAEEQRWPAVAEEVDEIAGLFDDALHALLAALAHVATTLADASALADRAAGLATTLPHDQTGPRHIASAAAEQTRAIRRGLDQIDTETRSLPLPLPPRSITLPAPPPDAPNAR